MKFSAFRMVSVGYAAENLALDESELEVFPAELLPFTDGEISSETTRLTQTMRDGDGNEYSVTANLSNTIRAKWLPMGGNQITPPNIRRAMRVELWQSGDDAGEYYWRYSGIDNHLMRLETVVLAFSNTRDESVTALTADNSWYIEISTHSKAITVKTNKSDGEQYAYTFQIDAAGNQVTLEDDDGQTIKLDSKERRIFAVNKDQSIVDVNKTKIFVKSKDEINMDTKTMNIQTENLNATAKNAVFNFDNWICNGNTLQVNHMSTFTNLVNTLALLTMSGGFAAIPGGGGGSGAGGSITVPLKVVAPVDTTGPLMNNGKVVGSPHTHTSTSPGSPTSPVI